MSANGDVIPSFMGVTISAALKFRQPFVSEPQLPLWLPFGKASLEKPLLTEPKQMKQRATPETVEATSRPRKGSLITTNNHKRTQSGWSPTPPHSRLRRNTETSREIEIRDLKNSLTPETTRKRGSSVSEQKKPALLLQPSATQKSTH